MYFHFPGGKDELVIAALEYSTNQVEKALQNHKRRSARESLECYVGYVADHIEKSQFWEGCPIATTALDVAHEIDEIGTACDKAYERLLTIVSDWLIQDGMSRKNAEETAFMFYSTLEGALLFSKASRSREPLDRVRKRVRKLVQL